MVKHAQRPPYLPFASFLTALDQLAQGMPNVISKEVFPSHSGLLQGQVISALRFFDLIDEHGTPLGDHLERLAVERETEQRRANIRPLVKSAYPDLIKLDLAKVSPSQLDAAFAGYGVTGDTKKKAKIFFLHAAKFAELKLSPLLVRKGRAPSVPKRRKVAEQSTGSDKHAMSHENHTSTSKTIQLKSGVILTVSITGNLLDLEEQDRQLVFGIMDQIRTHPS